MLVLFSGPVGCGKTTLCWRLAGVARGRGFCVVGVLTPPLVEDRAKVGIEAVDLRAGAHRAGQARTLARNDRDLGGPRVGQYSFDGRTLEWVASLCTSALTQSAASACCGYADKTLVFVDEIGRLELDRGAGLARTIPLLAATSPLLARVRDRHAIVIVRNTLLDRLVARVREAEPRVVVLDPQCREAAWAEMTGLLFAEDGDRW